MAAFLHRAVVHHSGPPAPAAAVDLKDVPDGAWYREFAEWAVSAGVMRAPEGMFDPGTVVSRADMAVMLTAAFEHLNPNRSGPGAVQRHVRPERRSRGGRRKGCASPE